MGLGGYGGMPFRFGGGRSPHQVEHEALLRHLAHVLDPSIDEGFYAETYAEARMLAAMWACNGRLRNQSLPTRMLEALPTWETACRLRPSPADSDASRRAAVSGRLRGVSNNADGDLEEAARNILGARFVAFHTVAPANVLAYWPGVNPGPPGFEWSSNRARLSVEMSAQVASDAEYVRLRGGVHEMLDASMPAWTRSTVGAGNRFIVNQGVLGKTLL